MLGALLVHLPWLGAPGLWDPWEPHYAEVARGLLVRGDPIHPWYELAWFFSKPILPLWLAAAGLSATGGAAQGGPLPALTEWGVRLPFALLSVLASAVTFAALRRLQGRRAAALGALALTTSPLWVLLSRQAVPDLPFVALVTCSILAFAVGLFAEDERSRRDRDLWLYGAWAAAGLATLAKGLLGLALPAAVGVATLAVIGRPGLLLRARLPTGLPLLLAIASPWYVAMALFPGVDDESRTFVERFFLHDHLKRLGGGVHTTTPGGSFVYFVEQAGYALFPWIVALPGVAGRLAARLRGDAPRDRTVALLSCWALVSFLLFATSATKFHHYVLPLVPPLALLAALWLDEWLDEPGPPAVLLPLAGLALLVVVGLDLVQEPARLVHLFVYRYDRPWPDAELAEAGRIAQLPFGGGALSLGLGPRAILPLAVALLAGGLAAAFVARRRRAAVALLATLATLFALWLGWVHWRHLAPHWSQRDLWRVAFEERRGDELFGAYYLNWRGETFYTKNGVRELRTPEGVREFFALPGRKLVAVERDRLRSLQSFLGERRARVLFRASNKYLLVEVPALDEEAAALPEAPPGGPQD